MDFNDTTDAHGVTLTADDINSAGKGNSYSVLFALNVSDTAVLDGFRHHRGTRTKVPEPLNQGGGMHAVNSNAVIRNSHREFRPVKRRGIYASLSGSRMTNCYFSGKHRIRGGGMHIENSDGVILEDCIFQIISGSTGPEDCPSGILTSGCHPPLFPGTGLSTGPRGAMVELFSANLALLF